MIRRVRNLSRRVASSVIDFAFPPCCLVCGDLDWPHDGGLSSVSVCDDCFNQLAPDIGNACERCGAEVGPHVSTLNGCVHCRSRTLKFDSVVCLGMYDDRLRQAILSGKWSFSSATIRSLARVFATARNAELSAVDAELIIPIPQSWQARVVRRFNSPTQIASVLAESLGIPTDEHIVRRRRNSRPQKRVAVHDRFDNQKDAFRVQDLHVIKDKNVLIVDDVLTTGATCSEVAKILKQNGAKSCSVAVLARVLDGT